MREGEQQKIRDQLHRTPAMTNETNRNELASNPHADIDGQSIDQRANQNECHTPGDTGSPSVLGRDPVS
jgi:hypothetical protein